MLTIYEKVEQRYLGVGITFAYDQKEDFSMYDELDFVCHVGHKFIGMPDAITNSLNKPYFKDACPFCRLDKRALASRKLDFRAVSSFYFYAKLMEWECSKEDVMRSFGISSEEFTRLNSPVGYKGKARYQMMSNILGMKLHEFEEEVNSCLEDTSCILKQFRHNEALDRFKKVEESYLKHE